MKDQTLASSMDERRRMIEANVAAARYFRKTLLHATSGWPLEYLKDRGMEAVLSTESKWKVGYAPNTWTGLVDQLRSEGFGYGTLVKAGLVTWSDLGEAQDAHRDRLMLLTTDQRLSPVGFVSIARDGVANTSGKVSMIYRRSNALLGVAEQRDLLSTGAIPVVVDDPADAIVISNVSRELGGRWAGIPVCGDGLSTAQARMLRRYTTSERVIVAMSGTVKERNETAGYILDLAYFFDRIRGVELPAGPAALSMVDGGPQLLHDLLAKARPLMSFRASGIGFLSSISADPDPPKQGPEL